VWQSSNDTAQRIQVNDSSVYYLKRSSGLALRHLLRPMLFGHLPCSGPLRELKMLQQLRARGFLTMEPVAWGERRVSGIPRQGFLLVKAVEGEEVVLLASKHGDDALSELASQIGHLLARLHLAGFFQPVRLKDLIKTNAGLVLIDRETSKPWRSFFSKRRCSNSLRRSLSRSSVEGCRLPSVYCASFWTSYSAEVHPKWKVSPVELMNHASIPIAGSPRIDCMTG
jgi:tRNA A-37 threonylcarbamoyl transferase component Bud32